MSAENMARLTPDQPSKRRQRETSGTRTTKSKGRKETSQTSRGSSPSPSGSDSSPGSLRSNANSSPLNVGLNESPRSSHSSDEINQDDRRVSVGDTPPTNVTRVRSSGMSLPLEFLKQIQGFVERQEAFNAKIEAHLQSPGSDERERRPRRLPKVVTANVRDVYKSLSNGDGEQVQWDLTKSFTGAENQTVNQQILAGVRSTDTETSTTVIRAAMRAHFKTKLRQHKNATRNLSGEILSAQRVRSRMNMKKNRRIQALKTSTVFTKDEKEDYMQYMTLDYMSSEHSESESKDDEKSGSSEDETNTSKVKVFSVSALPWRSAELRDLMYRLDRKSKRKRSAKSTNMTLQRKNKGIISKRPAPEDAPLFALAQ